MAAYADSDDLIARYDARTLGQLCSDDGVEVSEVNLASDTKITTALSTATGRVKAAALRAGRYTDAQLTALTGESLDYLKDITCAVAFYLLWRRRPYLGDEKLKAAKEEADEMLAAIKSGDDVFDVTAVIEAGKPKVETVTRTELATDWELIADKGRGRIFPRRRTYRNR